MTVKGKSEYKVPGGKMVRTCLAVKDGVIVNVKIAGDFFMYPEEALVELENYLKGKRIDEGELSKIIGDFLRERDIELLGVTAQDFAKAIQMAFDGMNLD